MRPTQFSEQIREDVSRRVRIISLAILERIVERSPVGNPDIWKVNVERRARGLPPVMPKGYVGGNFRANTIVSIGSPVLEWDEESIDKTGGPTIAKGSRSLSGLEPFTVVYITNNAPYSIRLEHGWSQQASQGIFQKSFNEVTQAYS